MPAAVSTWAATTTSGRSRSMASTTSAIGAGVQGAVPRPRSGGPGTRWSQRGCRRPRRSPTSGRRTGRCAPRGSAVRSPAAGRPLPSRTCRRPGRPRPSRPGRSSQDVDDVLHHADEAFRHVVQGAIGEHHRVLEQSVGVDLGARQGHSGRLPQVPHDPRQLRFPSRWTSGGRRLEASPPWNEGPGPPVPRRQEAASVRRGPSVSSPRSRRWRAPATRSRGVVAVGREGHVQLGRPRRRARVRRPYTRSAAGGAREDGAPRSASRTRTGDRSRAPMGKSAASRPSCRATTTGGRLRLVAGGRGGAAGPFRKRRRAPIMGGGGEPWPAPLAGA